MEKVKENELLEIRNFGPDGSEVDLQVQIFFSVTNTEPVRERCEKFKFH